MMEMPPSSREGVRIYVPPRESFEKFFALENALDEGPQAFAEHGKLQLNAVEEGSALPIQETRRVMNGARSQEKRLDAEVANAAHVAEQKRKSLFRRWMEHPIFKMGVISAAIHGTLVAKGMSMPEEVRKEIPQTVLQPQSVAEMERIELRRAEREARIDQEAVTEYKQSARERVERGEQLSLEGLYLDLEGLNGIPESTITEAKQMVSDLAVQFEETMRDGIDQEDLQGFVKTMYGSHENYDWGQGSVAKYLVTKKRNCVAVAKAEAMILEKIIQRFSPEEQARYSIGIQKLKQHEVATLTVQEHDTFRRYLLEPLDDEGRIAVVDSTEEEPGTKTIPIDMLLKAVIAAKPITMNAVEGSFLKGPDLIISTDQPLDDGIRIEGELRASSYVLGEAKRQGVEPVEVKELEWGTMELSLTTPEEDAAYERKLKYGEDLALRDAYDQADGGVGVIGDPQGYIDAMRNGTNRWFAHEGAISVDAVKRVNQWNDKEGVQYVYHGSLAEFDEEAIKEIVSTKVGIVSVLYLPEVNTEKIETLLDAAEGENKPRVEVQIREHEIDLGYIHSRSAEVREEVRNIVNRKNLKSVGLVFREFTTSKIEHDVDAMIKKDRQLNRLSSRTAHDIANGKVKDVYLSGRTIAPGDLLVLEHGKARVHIDLQEYRDLLISHPDLLGSEKILPWVRTIIFTAQAFDDPENEFTRKLPQPVIRELIRLWMESQVKPHQRRPEPYPWLDY